MTRVSLNAGEQLTYSRLDGSFAFYNVPPGVHLVDVYSHEFMFSQVKIQLLEESMDAPKCIEYLYPGANKQPIAHPLVLTAHATYQYFEKRPGFSILALLKNPMLLMSKSLLLHLSSCYSFLSSTFSQILKLSTFFI